MIIECQHTVQDYLAAQRLHFRPRPLLRAVYWLFAGLLIATLTHEVMTIIRGKPLFAGWWILPAGLAYGALLFFIFLPWRVGKIFRDNPNLSKPIRTRLAEDGLLMDTARGQVRLPWKVMKSWKRNQGMLLIYHSRVHFHLFPRRAFATQTDYDSLADSLRKNVGPETP